MELTEYGIAKRMVTALNKKHIYTTNDYALAVPRKYKDYRVVKHISDCEINTDCAVIGYLMDIVSNSNNGRKYVAASLLDEEKGTEFKVMWFGSDYMLKIYGNYVHNRIVVCGKVTYSLDYGYTITAPDIFDIEQQFKPRLLPIYKKMAGISEQNFKSKLYNIVKETKEPLEKEILEAENILNYQDALFALHYPKTLEDIEKAGERLLLNDMIYFAMSTVAKNATATGIKLNGYGSAVAYAKSLPYELTTDQKAVIRRFFENAFQGKRNRMLVQGDVGCGKTEVAITAMMGMAGCGYQSIMMAPTRVLAKQHFAKLQKAANKMGYTAVFLDSKMKAKEEREIKEKIKDGSAHFIVGTSKCLNADVAYKNVGLVITDEEHKFGVKQKEKLEKISESGGHIITMSATPIPRSIASVIYEEGTGREICSIKTMPAGRKEIQTCTQRYHKNTFAFMLKQIQMGHQCYVVCPAIEENEETDLVSVAETEKIYKEFFADKGATIATLTGKNSAEEVDDIITKFVNNEIQILIATTVIEVGVNVPNATLMVIEQAERFGLASLHQLRGRVGRGDAQSYCILISDDTNNERLNIMVRTNDGFEIAEADMELRGTGDLIGIKQSGFNKYINTIVKMPEMYKKAKRIAKICLEKGYGQNLLYLYEEHDMLCS